MTDDSPKVSVTSTKSSISAQMSSPSAFCEGEGEGVGERLGLVSGRPPCKATAPPTARPVTPRVTSTAARPLLMLITQ